MKIKGRIVSGNFNIGTDGIINNNNNKINITKNNKQTQINTDNPIKWFVDGIITDGDHINVSPSSNGYTTDKQYMVYDKGHIYNGNIYIVTSSDTWELLDNRFKGLSVVYKIDLKIYNYTTDDENGEWKISASLESKNDIYIDIDTDANSDENTSPDKLIIRKHKNTSAVEVASIDEKGQFFNIITGKALLTLATYVVDETGAGDYKEVQDCIDYISGDIQNRIGKIYVRKGQYAGVGLPDGNWSGLQIIGEGIQTKIDYFDTNSLLSNNGTVNILLDNFQINYSSGDSPTNHGIYLQYIKDGLIRNIYVSNWKNMGINSNYCESTKYINCIVDNITARTDNFDGYGFGSGSNLFFFGCYSYNCPRHGFNFHNWSELKNVTVIGSYAVNNNSYGFLVNNYFSSPIHNILISNSHAINNSGNDFYIMNGEPQHCSIQNCDTDGTIQVDGNYNRIIGNDATNIIINGNNNIVTNNFGSITDNGTDNDIAHNM